MTDQTNSWKIEQLITKDLTNGRRAYKMLLGVAFRVLKDYHQSEDAVLEGFTNSWRFAQNYRYNLSTERSMADDPKLMGWMYQIIANRARSLKRIRMRRMDREITEADFNSGIEHTEEFSTLEKYLTNDERPYDSLLETERSDAVKSAFQELPKQYSDIIFCRYNREMGYGEISRTLGICIGTVKSRLNQAKKELSKVILDNKQGHIRGLRIL